MSVLRNLRKRRGRAPQELATAGGFSVQEYYDLEATEDELTCVAPVGGVARIAQELGVKPSALYGGTSRQAIAVQQLAASIRVHIKNKGKSLTEFEEEVGWALAAALDDPNEFRDFTADGLSDVCSAIGVNWFDVLDGLA